MENKRVLIVGYDLCEDFSQISCYSFKSFEPVTICPDESEETCLIPTALFVNSDTKLWSYGKDAATNFLNGNGIYADNLLTKIRTGEVTEIYGQRISGITLLERFLKKSLIPVRNHFPTETIAKFVITVRDPEPKIVDGVYEALYQLGIERDRAVVISHASAYMYYALSQDKSLWLNDVGLFDFNEHGLGYYQISVNRRSNPMIASMIKKDFTETLNIQMLTQKDIDIKYIFEKIADMVVYKQIISTLYFTGNGFEGGWAEDIIKGLCAGRRVFMGPSLYTKGACYAAKELAGDKKLENIILLNNEMLVSSIWIRLYTDAGLREVLLSEAAVSWYEVDKSIEVIPDIETEIEIILRNIMTREVTKEKLFLHNLPDRPNRMTRLGINLTCSDRSSARITVTDLGFGEFYPSSGLSWEYSINI